MKSSSHTLRVQILDREGTTHTPSSSLHPLHPPPPPYPLLVRQLEQQVKTLLDSIAVDEKRKNELIRGDAVDKAEQLSECVWGEGEGGRERGEKGG